MVAAAGHPAVQNDPTMERKGQGRTKNRNGVSGDADRDREQQVKEHLERQCPTDLQQRRHCRLTGNARRHKQERSGDVIDAQSTMHRQSTEAPNAEQLDQREKPVHRHHTNEPSHDERTHGPRLAPTLSRRCHHDEAADREKQVDAGLWPGGTGAREQPCVRYHGDAMEVDDQDGRGCARHLDTVITHRVPRLPGLFSRRAVASRAVIGAAAQQA